MRCYEPTWRKSLSYMSNIWNSTMETSNTKTCAFMERQKATNWGTAWKFITLCIWFNSRNRNKKIIRSFILYIIKEMKTQELIEKYTKLHEAEQMIEAGEVLEDLKALQKQLSNEEKIKQENNLVWVVENKSNEEKIEAIMKTIEMKYSHHWADDMMMIKEELRKHLTKNIEEK